MGLCPKRLSLLLNEMDSDRLNEAMISLTNLVSRLRGPGGCPWDAEQTDLSVGLYLLEEAYEVLDAIEKSAPDQVCQELGDLLFHIVFLAQLAEERKEFDFAEVVEGIRDKMIHRHPHVFGKTEVKSVKEVALNWAKIKRREKESNQESTSFLEDVPMNLPALLGSHRLSERAAKAGLPGIDGKEAWDRAQERFETLRSEMENEETERFSDAIGDLILDLVHSARERGLNAESILRHSNRRFLNHFAKMEEDLRDSGIDPETATPEQMEDAWKRVKTRVVS